MKRDRNSERVSYLRNRALLFFFLLALPLGVLSTLAAEDEKSGESVLLKRVMRLEQELEQAQQQRDEIGSELADMAAARDKLRAQKEYLEEEWSKLESDPRFNRASDDGRIEELQQRIEKLERLNRELKKPSDSKQASFEQVESLQNERDRLMAELEALHASGKTETVKSGEEADHLNARIAELERVNNELRIDLEQMRELVARQERMAEERSAAREAQPDEQSADPRLATARKLFERGSIPQAEAIFKDVLQDSPEDLDANMGLAYCYYQNSLYSAALRISESLSQTHADNPEVYRLLGLSAWRCGDLQLATQAFEKGLELSPGDASLHNYLGVVNFSQGDFETARRQFVLAVELDDELIEANYNLAVLYSTPEKNDLKQARKHYEKAIQLGRNKNESLEKKIYR